MRRCRRQSAKPAPATANAPNAAPTPMPAVAPGDSPALDDAPGVERGKVVSEGPVLWGAVDAFDEGPDDDPDVDEAEGVLVVNEEPDDDAPDGFAGTDAFTLSQSSSANFNVVA